LVIVLGALHSCIAGRSPPPPQAEVAARQATEAEAKRAYRGLDHALDPKKSWQQVNESKRRAAFEDCLARGLGNVETSIDRSR